jgi:K+-sensing histidine kinase KdpD
MHGLRGIFPIAASLGLMSVVTAILWHLNLNSGGAHGLVYIYLFPVALIAALFNGRIAVWCTVMALACADLFLQEPLYSFANDNPREYGDLIYFAILAVTAIKFIRALMRPAQEKHRGRIA